MSYSAIPKTPPTENVPEDNEKETGLFINDSFPSSSTAQKPRQVLLKQHFFSAIALTILFIWGLRVSPLNLPSIFSTKNKHEVQTLREYNLTTGYKWANPDGGRWRVMFVCNGETPCPTLEAKEGDIIQLNVQNDAGTQSSIHVSGMSHRRFGYWNDGTAGLNQYPILPRGNWTSVYDTTDYWGLSWYIEHTTGTANDGLYGLVWVSPSPERPRPYSRIPSIDNTELGRIMEAESNPKHLVIKNHWQRTSDWKLLQMRAEGTDFHCYDSLLVNGKGRSHCRHPDYPKLGGNKLDSTGCIRPLGQEVQDCEPSAADYEIIETNSQPWMLLNLLNVGFEHAVKVSIDGHKMWIVANDGGFVEPKLVDVVYITNAARVTVLVKLDAEPADYAIRISSTSQVQMLQGYSLLRYPAKRYPKLGEPMIIPEPLNPRQKCLLPDASINPGCIEADLNAIPPFPATKPPEKATKIFSLSAGVQKSKTETYVLEYFLNKKPWQIFRGAMTPLLFTDETTSYEDPILSEIPIGSIVDVIVQNTMNDTVSLYKHGKPSWLLGSKAFSEFQWENVEDARKEGVDLNLENPPLVLSHDLPPLGWSVLRFKVDGQAVTSLHAAKLKYFVLGMSAPIIEGITKEQPLDAPVYAKSRPHVEFEPANDGIFGK